MTTVVCSYYTLFNADTFVFIVNGTNDTAFFQTVLNWLKIDYEVEDLLYNKFKYSINNKYALRVIKIVQDYNISLMEMNNGGNNRGLM